MSDTTDTNTIPVTATVTTLDAGMPTFVPFILTIQDLGAERPHTGLVFHAHDDDPVDPGCVLAVYPDGRILHFGREVDDAGAASALRMVAAQIWALYPAECGADGGVPS